MWWVLEAQAFMAEHEGFVREAKALGHQVIDWDDLWWQTRRWPLLDQPERPVLFRGSLGNVARVARELDWSPGVFGSVEDFACSAWYERAQAWMLPGGWLMTTAQAVIEDEALGRLMTTDEEPRLFVRPDSPLKPFAGKVLTPAQLSWEGLEFGFYYEDRQLPVVLRPWHPIAREWRFVVVGDEVVAGSEYVAQGRQAKAAPIAREVWRRAQEIADAAIIAHQVYVLDLCVVSDELYLLELNPFAGASLYGCDARAILAAIEEHIKRC